MCFEEVGLFTCRGDQLRPLNKRPVGEFELYLLQLSVDQVACLGFIDFPVNVLMGVRCLMQGKTKERFAKGPPDKDAKGFVPGFRRLQLPSPLTTQALSDLWSATMADTVTYMAPAIAAS